jgi:hypothetical protein
MPNLAMCSGTLTPERNHVAPSDELHVCPMRADCYRFTARPSPYWQSWLAAPYDARTGRCAYHLPTYRTPDPPADA